MSADFRLHGWAAAARPPRRPRRAPVTTTRVPEAAWTVALRLAGGDTRRLRVTGPDTVVVMNRPRVPR